MEYRYEIPEVTGEAKFWPEFAKWAALVEQNRRQAESWRFSVAGVPAQVVRESARAEAVEQARAWSAAAGTPSGRPAGSDAPIIFAGHQPDLYHCGVWVKQFALQRIAAETGAVAVDVVVDSDSYQDVGFLLPCIGSGALQCRHVVVGGGADSCFACSAPPSGEQLTTMRAAAISEAARLGPGVSERVGGFLTTLEEMAASSHDLGEALTRARRAHEGTLTDYLELPVSVMIEGSAYHTFVADVVFNASRFAEVHNSVLSQYRGEHGIRSGAQPFPDLEADEARVEAPFWVLQAGRRVGVSVQMQGGVRSLIADGDVLVELGSEVTRGRESLHASGVRIAPKAIALTLYLRTFCSDLFIHGVGGARYDAVTDQVCRAYYGIEPPQFATTSLSMRLPLETEDVSAHDLASLKARINRLEQNPDEAVIDLPLEETARIRASALVERKQELVREIALPGADKKAIGASIRDVNADLRDIVQPERDRLQQELAETERKHAEMEVLTDREYPYFLWSAEEIAATVK